MAITIEEAKAFITDAERFRENWLRLAERSWNEIKKARKDNKLWARNYAWNNKRARYPAWYSIFKIRQPLLLSRVGIPVGKDTTQDGNDNVGATAAICLERLAVNLARSFPFFETMAAPRDDFLVTNFGFVRGYYERDEVKQRVKEYINPQPNPETGEMMFVNAAGMEVLSDDIYQDDEGFFIYHDEVVDVENEKICLEPVLYKNVYIDPDIMRWNRCKRLAFKESYSRREFEQIFGTEALKTLPEEDRQNPGYDEAYPKKQLIDVFEYWDEYEKEVKWFCDNAKDFIEPKGYMKPDAEEEIEDYGELNGLYDLENFFPCPAPLMMNTATDEFWPIPEYYQLIEVLEDIHTIFSRMVVTTKAYRARLLFDNNVEGLEAALNEATEGDAFGVPNLAQSLSSSGGSLDGVTQYIPTDGIIKSLEQLYVSLEQRLNTVYKLTGTSDLLQGLVTDPTQRTLGERQMTEKYALNQLADPQRKMQEFVRDSYQLMCEMALKNFKDSSLDMYIMPQTLQPDHKERYRAALGMLKENSKRFRIELETDSTIALNEQYDKQMRIELVNALTTALEKTANIATTSPALVVPELHALKFLIQGFRQGKMFQNEITQAIENVIKQAEQQKAPPFNKDETMAKLKEQELQAANQIKIAELQANQVLEQGRMQLEVAKLQQNERIAGLESQLEQFKIQSQGESEIAKLQLQYSELSAEISKAQQDLALKRDALLVELQKIADKKEVDQFALMIDEGLAAHKMQLEAQQQALNEYKAQLDMQEKYMTEARLQDEHRMNEMMNRVDVFTRFAEIQKPEPQPAPTINVSLPSPPRVKRKTKVVRDQLGNALEYETSDVQDPVGE